MSLLERVAREVAGADPAVLSMFMTTVIKFHSVSYVIFNAKMILLN